MNLLVKSLLSVCAGVVLSGCGVQRSIDGDTEQPLLRSLEPIRERSHQRQEQTDEGARVSLETRSYTTPKVTVDHLVTNVDAQDLGDDLVGNSITVNYNNLPIPAFINEVFGEKLGLSFTLSPKLRKQNDLVTLRITEEIHPSELFRVARTTLGAYGVSINKEGNLFVFDVGRASGNGGQTPLLVSGRALPDVPDSQRPIFMFVPLEVVSNNKVRAWLTDLLKGQDLLIKEDPIRNAIVLQGKPAQVEQALAIIKSLDQPLMRGKYSIAIEPAYVKVSDLAENLEKILKSEGIDASRTPPLGSVILLALNGSNTLVVFAPSQKTIDHVRQWVETIDRKQQLSVDQGIFSYRVNTTQAQHIVNMLNGLGAGEKLSKEASGIGQSSGGSRFVVDENRNAIVFKGSGQEWLELLPVIRDMDVAAPSVLVEVLLAEVTLNDDEGVGLDFLAKGSVTLDGRNYGANLGTLGALGVGGSGFSAVLDSAGQTRATLNLFYENKRAEIRSQPRLMVKSGQEATIDVGTEIPIVTSRSQATADAGAPIIQNVQYRKTGVRLNIRPVVHASGYVDIEVEQELSEAQTNSSSGIDSPSIFNRKITTTATLRDGGSLVLGGLISRTESNGEKGMPVLGKIPLLGRFFSSDSTSQSRTELLVMIVPYVMSDPEEGEELTKTLVKELAR